MASNSLFHSQKLSAKDQEESESSAEMAASFLPQRVNFKIQ